MSGITLTEQQTQLVMASSARVPVYGAKGELLGFLDPPLSGWSAEELAEAERRFRSGEPGYTYAEVKAYLDSLGTA